MKTFSKTALLLTVILVSACVERYYPNQDDLKKGTLVINAHLTDQPGDQVIEFSRSVGLTYPSFFPVSGSFAQAVRDDGAFREFSEFIPGYYIAYLDEDFLQTGSSFFIRVITPDGNEYESDFDKLRPCLLYTSDAADD